MIKFFLIRLLLFISFSWFLLAQMQEQKQYSKTRERISEHWSLFNEGFVENV